MSARDDLVRRLSAAGCVAPHEEAAALRAAAGGVASTLEDLVARRCEGEPLAWLVGWVEFCDVRVAVHPGVYVPRWQTEQLALRAADLLPPRGVAVDICTGAGAIACVLQDRVPSATVTATDTDPAAVACARSNGVAALLGDLDAPLPAEIRGHVDVVTGVVPYVPTGALGLLPRDVVAFEPRVALDGGDGGLTLLTAAVVRMAPWLRPGGWLLLELGGDQAGQVAGLLQRTGFDHVAILRDGEGDDRGIVARRVSG